jgi:hypothetical protein
MTKKTLSVRIEPDLHTKVYADVNSNAYVVEKALHQFYRSKEPNSKLYTDTHTNVYDADVMQSLQDHIIFLQKQVTFLQQQNAFLSLPWYKKMVHRLEAKKE